MQSLYQQQIMDHYHFPRHKGRVTGDGSVRSASSNPSCGDAITISACIQQGVITDARFEGVGCILSLAAADILLENSIGKTVADLSALQVEDIKKMVGIDVGHTRIKCILLAFDVLKDTVRHA